MPFIGLDWRAPGEEWIKTAEGWEKKKLKPIPSDCSIESAGLRELDDVCHTTKLRDSELVPRNITGGGGCNRAAETTTTTQDAQPPHYFLAMNKSSQFIRDVSLSDAFQKLDFISAISDVRRFNYVSKVVEILVKNKLVNLSGSGRKILLSLIERLTEHCLRNYVQLYTLRSLIADLTDGLNKGHHYGSEKLLAIHQSVVRHLVSVVCDVSMSAHNTHTRCSYNCVRLLDLPVDCLLAVLSRLSDHNSLMNVADAHHSLWTLVSMQCQLWRRLCCFHFTQQQIAWALDRNSERPGCTKAALWRSVYFDLKKWVVYVL
ncbi:unnamed protein product [Soboliphyme baturini]|uniref:F-box only protein 25 n=1 Tax=Soboliphyme baturini TaxID=241478 RepID=A0A183IU02_9BILA|nr:unnamed protein product [Soboliphyme baturini]